MFPMILTIIAKMKPHKVIQNVPQKILNQTISPFPLILHSGFIVKHS